MTGSVRWWQARGRYGQIRGADRAVYFCYFTDLVDVLELRAGQRVTFVPTQTEGGRQAVEVQPLETMRPTPQEA
jgi:cold shock CspA family protein